MAKILKARLQQSKNTEAKWLEKNPILLNGERVFVDIVDENSNEIIETKEKIGDGKTPFKELPYFSISNSSGLISSEGMDENTIIEKNQMVLVPNEFKTEEDTEENHIFYSAKVGNNLPLSETAYLANLKAGQGYGAVSQVVGENGGKWRDNINKIDIVPTEEQLLLGPTADIYPKDPYASGWTSAAFNQYTQAKGHYSFATGYDTQANGRASFSSGQATRTKGLYSSVFGFKNNSVGSSASCFGSSNTNGYETEELESWAEYDLNTKKYIPYETGEKTIYTFGNLSSTFGSNNKNYLDQSVVFGSSNTVGDNTSYYTSNVQVNTKDTKVITLDNGEQKTLYKITAYLKPTGVFVAGSSNKVYGEKIFAAGNNNTITGDYNMIAGKGNTIEGIGSSVFGINNSTGKEKNGYGNYNFLAGYNNIADVNYSFTTGLLNNSASNYTFTGGEYNKNAGLASLTYGLGLSNTRPYAAMFGSYNENSVKDLALIVGGGTSVSNTDNTFSPKARDTDGYTFQYKNILTLNRDGTLELSPGYKSNSGEKYETEATLSLDGTKLTKTKLSQLLTLLGDGTSSGSIDEKIATEIAKVVANAPEDFDTLKEIADWINNDTTGAAKMANDIQNLKDTYLSNTKAEEIYATKEELKDQTGLTDEDLAVIRAAASKESVEAIYKYDEGNETGKLVSEMNERIEADMAINEEIATLKTKTNTLIGNDTNKSIRKIANEELALQLISEDAQESLDTLQEIATWIQEHPKDAASINQEITDLWNEFTFYATTDYVDQQIELAIQGAIGGSY